MKKWISMALTLALLLGLCPAMAEEAATYKLGDKMEDFTATLSDGTQVSLYGLLAEKKAVLINFWASWCGPCRMEFPYLDQAYSEMSDEIGVIALSTGVQDTNETVEEIKQELRISAVPMGVDVDRLNSRFSETSIPLSVMVDRNGVICFMHAGAVTDKEDFLRLFKVFTAEDYSEPALLEKIPEAMPDAEQPTAEALGAALGLDSATMQAHIVDMPQVWPVIPSEDGSYVIATNGKSKGTIAAFGVSVKAEAGQALGYEYAIDCEPVNNSLRVFVNDEVMQVYGGKTDWTGDYVTFAEAGTYEVAFAYARGQSNGETSAMLRGLHLISAEEAAALDAQKPAGPAKTLKGKTADIELVDGEWKQVDIVRDGEVFDQGGKLAVQQTDKITLRIRIGDEIHDDLACMQFNSTNYFMLMDLEQDEQGYLFTFDRTTQPEQLLPSNSISVYETLADVQSEPLTSITWCNTGAHMDGLVGLVVAIGMQQGIEFKADWQYKDGSGKQGTPEAADTALANGMGRYAIAVTDEEGKAVEGVIIQICDATTCQLATTDAAGMVTHVATCYPYEIHVLKVPDGYANVTETYAMPEEGGDLAIRLKKQ